MQTPDWIFIIALFLAVSVAAYRLGRRRSEPEPAAAKAPEPPNAAPEPDDVKTTAGTVAAKEKTEPAKQQMEAQKSRPSDVAVVRLDFEEDEDIDPTRVGAGASASAPPARVIYQPPIQRIVYDEDAATEEPTGAQSLFLVHATAQTDRGLRRKRNEDSLLVLERANLFVVADGMGGYRGGELASQLAVKTLANAYTQSSFEGAPHDGVPTDATNLARAIQMANAAILEVATKKKDLEGMGTTVVAARFSPNKKRVYVGHVGDSRCYRLRDGILKQMTADHTMADHGVKGPESQQLSRAVGIWPTVPIDVVMGVPKPGDVYLLCSDGLTKMLRDETIGQVLRAEEDPKSAVDRLILFANSRGGKDNITVVLVRVVPPDWKPKPAEPFMDTRDKAKPSGSSA